MNFFKGFTYKQMNDVYNVMDVFFLSTSGEGFGVPIIEAAACGIPSIVTDYTTTKELLMENGQCGIPVKIKGEICGSWNVERGIMCEDTAAEALKTYYDNPELRKQHGKVGREKVLKYYSWDIVIHVWNDLINKMVDDYENIRHLILERDKFTCQSCGKKETLEIHHIVPFLDSFDNSFNNLTTLCRVCHRKEDRRIIKEKKEDLK